MNRNVANTLRMDMERSLLEEFRRGARVTCYDVSKITSVEGGAGEAEGGRVNDGVGVLAQLLAPV